MDPKLIGISAALGSAASWALGSILFKRLGESLSSLAMTLAKQVVSLVLLAVALVFVGMETVDRQSLVLLMASGLLGIAVGDTLFFEALQDLGPVALLLLMTLGQVLTVLFAVFLLGDAPSPAKWGGIALVIAGVAAVVSASLSGEKRASGLRGIALGLASVVCMSLSIVIAKKGLDSVSAIQATFIRMAAGAVGVLAVGMVFGRLKSWVTPFRNPSLLAFFLTAVCVITFGGFWLSLVAIKYVDVPTASTLSSCEPLFVLPLAAFFLKEKISWRAILGTALTLPGIALLCAS